MSYLNTLCVVPSMVNLDVLEKLEQYANRLISVDQAVDGIKAIMGADYIHEDWMQLMAYLLDNVTVVTRFAEVKDQFLQLLVAQPDASEDDVDEEELQEEEEVGQTLIRTIQPPTAVGQSSRDSYMSRLQDIIDNYEQGHSSPLQSSGVPRGVLDLKDVVPQAVYVVKFLSAGAWAFVMESLWLWLPNRIYIEATSPKHILDNNPPSHIDAT
ncbi:hypothetical protein SCLCIDRAFT_10137 [Scleroderma citrinum Foug A]|uniref:Uncharacterized protein n=1 Tax=Scleroderma citrinum Foug A TaxID=1036808 RepID=A0A0C2ZA98_9AGAM|nr:hypothetical protein SCLCIDRAFT_10137 [Scleroderma citrinum Foug A]